jgi:hypothetical protein
VAGRLSRTFFLLRGSACWSSDGLPKSERCFPRIILDDNPLFLYIHNHYYRDLRPQSSAASNQTGGIHGTRCSPPTADSGKTSTNRFFSSSLIPSKAASAACKENPPFQQHRWALRRALTGQKHQLQQRYTRPLQKTSDSICTTKDQTSTARF